MFTYPNYWEESLYENDESLNVLFTGRLDSVYQLSSYFGDGTYRVNSIPYAWKAKLIIQYDYKVFDNGDFLIAGSGIKQGSVELIKGNIYHSAVCSPVIEAELKEVPGFQMGKGPEMRSYAINMISKDTVIYAEDVSMVDSTDCYECAPPELRLPPDTTICEGDTLWLNAGPPYNSYEWSDGINGRTRPLTAAGTYTLTARNECGTATDTIRLQLKPAPVPVLDLSAFSAFPEDSITFTDRTPGAMSRLWSFGDGDSSRDATVKHAYSRNGNYNVSLTVTDSLGCTATATARIGVEGHSLYMPSGFTPGADGRNDLFGPQGYGMANYRLMVYNRWGEIVFEGDSQGWDGSFHGKTVPEGLYRYQLTVQYDTGRYRTLQGSIMVLRP